MSYRLALPLVSFAFLACTPKSIATKYSVHSGCPVDKVVVLDIGTTKNESDMYRASGCGHGVQFYCRVEQCVSPEISVATRHARQFGCSTDDVVVQDLEHGAWMGTGCGHVVTYQCIESDEHVLRCIAETADEANGARRRVADE